jgi:hypothetical protein
VAGKVVTVRQGKRKERIGERETERETERERGGGNTGFGRGREKRACIDKGGWSCKAVYN